MNLRTVYRLIDAGKLPAVRVGGNGGSAAATSTPGSTASGPRGPRARPRRSGRWTGGRALVVDPDGPARDAAAGALRDAGWVVDTAPDGTVALDRLRRTPYDLIVTELQLPGPRRVRAGPRGAADGTPGLRVMIVTGHSSETAAIEALNLGVAGYLVKPSRPTEIAATAARVLGG